MSPGPILKNVTNKSLLLANELWLSPFSRKRDYANFNRVTLSGPFSQISLQQRYDGAGVDQFFCVKKPGGMCYTLYLSLQNIVQ